MIEILDLKPEDRLRLNSPALKRFNDWQDGILRQVPHLSQLSVEQIRADLGTHLHDNELSEFSKMIRNTTSLY